MEEIKEYKSKSYNPKSCCNSDCWMLDWNENPEEPCWGFVHAIDEIESGESSSWVHSCQGHEDMYDGDNYCKEQ
jgi:hypothetical protein